MAESILIVTGAAHQNAVREQLSAFENVELVVEPTPKDSTAAICLAAAIIDSRDPDAIIGSFAADHVINGPEAFELNIAKAISGAERGFISTIGIRPTGPSTAFGYIQVGGESADGIFAVQEFVEKPSIDVASEYYRSGNYWWNAGMFVARPSVLLAELNRQLPEMSRQIQQISDAWGTESAQICMQDHWPRLVKVAIDYAIIEPAARNGQVVSVRSEFEWDDIGDFQALSKLCSLGQSESEFVVVGQEPNHVTVDSTGFLVTSTSKLIATIGLRDIVIIDTEDALLIASKDRVQEVKNTVETLKTTGRLQYT